MDAIEAIKSRRSVRHFQKKLIPQKKLISLLEAACSAPSAHNSQPWKFVVFAGKKKKELAALLLSKATEEKYQVFVGFYINRLLKHAARMIEEAPFVVAVFSTGRFVADFKRFFKGRSLEKLRVMEIQSVAAAIENLLLAAHAEGFGGVWLGVPLFLEEDFIRELAQEDAELMALVPLGYPARSRFLPKKVNLEEKIKFLK